MLELKKTDIDYAEIVANLVLKEKSQEPKETIENYVYILNKDENLCNLIKFNELSGRPENSLTGENWSDADDGFLKMYIEKYYHLRNNECFKNAFAIVQKTNSYNPIKVKLENEEWDGKPHIENILQKYLKCEDTDYTREVARLIFAGGIARLYDCGCKFDFMPILVGEQGTGKSTFIRWLALDDKYYKEVGDISGKEGVESLSGGWICEIGELLAFTKTKEVEAIKSFITKTVDHYRLPYNIYSTDLPRKCIFLGTTNASQFLTDKTGNRRFLPLKVNIDKNILFENEVECKKDILQCWLEAKHYYDVKDYSLVLNQKVNSQVKEIQKIYLEDDWRVGVINEYLQDKNVEKTCIKDIWDYVFGYEDKIMTKKDSNEIALIMDTNFTENWVKVNSIRIKNYGIQRGWKKKNT